MASDPIRGKTIRWTYDDGPMAGKSFEHTFGDDGVVTWREAGDPDKGTKPPTNGKQTIPILSGGGTFETASDVWTATVYGCGERQLACCWNARQQA